MNKARGAWNHRGPKERDMLELKESANGSVLMNLETGVCVCLH